MRQSSPYFLLFYLGMLTAFGLIMFVQSRMGMEGFTQMMVDRWINFHWSIGLAMSIGSPALAIIVTRNELRRPRKNDLKN